MKKEIDPKMLIGFSDLIKQFYNLESDELEQLQVKMIHLKILHLLSDHNGISQQEITLISGLKKSTMSETISEMAAEGYIERRIDPDDKRRFFIFLKPLGVEKANKIRESFAGFCKACTSDFSEEEIGIFEDLLRRFQQGLQRTLL